MASAEMSVAMASRRLLGWASRRRSPSALFPAVFLMSWPCSAEAQAQEDSACDSSCVSITCISRWWRDSDAVLLVLAAVMVFFATFLPRVLVRLVIFVLTKLPFLRQYDEQLQVSSSSNASLTIYIHNHAESRKTFACTARRRRPT